MIGVCSACLEEGVVEVNTFHVHDRDDHVLGTQVVLLHRGCDALMHLGQICPVRVLTNNVMLRLGVTEPRRADGSRRTYGSRGQTLLAMTSAN